MTDEQMKAWEKFMLIQSAVKLWSRKYPGEDVPQSLLDKLSDEQRAYAEARRETVGEARR